jgi:hypothetical protein
MVGIGARVTLSFILSGPINAAFYVYGTAVHHTTEWWLLEVPYYNDFEWDQLWAKALLKLETELPQTMIASGSCWIPINLFTFTYVPPHLRPLSLMFFSIFWNCYLSLSQHKDLVLPTPQELQI